MRSVAHHSLFSVSRAVTATGLSTLSGTASAQLSKCVSSSVSSRVSFVAFELEAFLSVAAVIFPATGGEVNQC